MIGLGVLNISNIHAIRTEVTGYCIKFNFPSGSLRLENTFNRELAIPKPV